MALSTLFIDNFNSEFYDILKERGGELDANTLHFAKDHTYQVAGFMGEATGVAHKSFFSNHLGPRMPLYMIHAIGDPAVPFLTDNILFGSDFIKNQIEQHDLDNKIGLVSIISNKHFFLDNEITRIVHTDNLILVTINLVISNAPIKNIHINCTPDYFCNQIARGGLEEAHTMDLEIYPNPTTDYILLKLEDPEWKKMIIKDLFGVKVMELPNTGHEIDVSTLTQGSYLVEVHTSNGVLSKSFIKN